MSIGGKPGVRALLGVSLLSAALLLSIGCGASEDPETPPGPTPTATSRPAATQPAATQPAATQPAATQPAATQPAATQPAATQPAATQPAATQPAATSTPPGKTIVPKEETVAPTPTPRQVTSSSGADHYEGVTFVISEGSEATFTVEEQLVRLPLPNDAVMRTTALSGRVHLDGRPSVIEVDLQQLSSDQEFRDRYVRSRMFGEHPIGIFTLPSIASIPDGLVSGEEVAGRLTGSLDIRGNTYPLEFDIEARDDGDVMYVVGRTTVTWQQLDIPVPTARSVVSVENEIRVEVLLALTPESQ